MIGEITQKNVHLLLPSKVCWLAEKLMARQEIGLEEAVCAVYASETYAQLEQEATKWWHLGPVDLYRAFSGENPSPPVQPSR